MHTASYDPLDRLLELASIPPPPPAAPQPEPVGAPPDIGRLLPILRCPETRQPLRRADDGTLETMDGRRTWPLIAGRPNLFPNLENPRIHGETHVSNPLDQSALRQVRQTDGWVLNLSAGGTVQKFEHVVEAEAAVFRHTDILADAHCLPFADRTFALVVAYNAFEHYRDPRLAADEIFRVLRPGGQVLIRTAFLQPLHEAPWHFYNCTRYGLMRWFAAFETSHLVVSENFHAGHTLGWIASECEAALRRDVSSAAADLFKNATIGDFIAMWREEAPRSKRLWRNFLHLTPDSQEIAAAGFEYMGRRPLT